MYGMADNYGSPAAQQDAFGDDDLAQIDAYLDADDEDDEFGGLLGIKTGIALTKKQKKKKIDKIVGKLKSYFEDENWDKLKKYSKKLTHPVKNLQKRDPDYKPEPDVVAFVDYAETGDLDALKEALGAIAWTGKEISEDEIEEGEVYTAEGGGGRPYRGRGRHLPPGFRPRGYTRWSGARKSYWLSRHPRAASIRVPADPGWMPGRGPGRVPHGYRPAPHVPRGPSPRDAYRRQAHLAAARTAGRIAGRHHAQQRAQQRAQSSSPSMMTRPAAFSSPAAARSRFGLDEAIEEGVDEFGALIGSDAFLPLQGKDGLAHDSLFEDDLDDEISGLDDDEDDDEFGAYVSEYGAYVPQFGAVFKRDIEDKLEAARRRYERLRATSENQSEVDEAWAKYQSLQKAYATASLRPSAQRKGPALAEELTFRLRPAPVDEDEGEDDDEDEDVAGDVP